MYTMYTIYMYTMTYNRAKLFNLLHYNHRIDHSVWTIIRSLGINSKSKTRRGHTGGRNRCLKQISPLNNDHTRHDLESGNSNFALWNARSIKLKIPMLCDLIISNHLDIIALTETWLCGDERDNHPIADLTASLPTHSFYHVPRTDRAGGGVGVCIKKSFKVCENQHRLWDSFEYLDILVSSSQKTPLRLVVVYRPQKSKTGHQTFAAFIIDFSSFLEEIVSVPNRILITGDFNFHIDDQNNREATIFLELISSFNLRQHVLAPTHRLGHTLDLVLTRASENFISVLSTTHYLPSDHAAVTCSLNIGKPGPVKLDITTRKIHAIDIESFRKDILQSELYTSPSPTRDLDMWLSMNRFFVVSLTSMPLFFPVRLLVAQMLRGIMMNCEK